MIRLDPRTTGFPLLPTVVTRRAFIRKSLVVAVVAVVAALRQSVSRAVMCLGVRLPLTGGRSKFYGKTTDYGRSWGQSRGADEHRLCAGSHGREDQRHPHCQLHRQ